MAVAETGGEGVTTLGAGNAGIVSASLSLGLTAAPLVASGAGRSAAPPGGGAPDPRAVWGPGATSATAIGRDVAMR